MRDGADHLLGLLVVLHAGVRRDADLHREDLLHDAARLRLRQGSILGLVLLQQLPDGRWSKYFGFMPCR